MRSILAWLTSASTLLVVYHLVVYPAVLQILAGPRKPVSREVRARRYRESIADVFLPTVAVVVPAFNEAKFIQGKIINLATLDYPSHRLQVVIVCDGCSDLTAESARAAAALPECCDLRVDILEFPVNRGKLAILNEVIPFIDADLIALSDASALVSIDSLLIGADHFRDRNVGLVCTKYYLSEDSAKGESHYWSYQTTIKEREALIGAVIGAHGAFYMFRRSLFEKLPADTINDDFALPMSIIAKGFRAVYEPRMVALELEAFDQRRDFLRRQRIAAGNLQQVVRCIRLLNPQFGGAAFAFVSGKVLRAILPFLLLLSFMGSLALAPSSPVFAILALGQGIAYASAGFRHALPRRRWPNLLDSLHYFVSGQLAGLIGATCYLLGCKRSGWGRKNVSRGIGIAVFTWHPRLNSSHAAEISHVHPLVRVAKRLMDISIATFVLVITAPVTAIVALAIKCDSNGPIIYRQLRIGESRQDHTKLFFILKFRTMKADAEAMTGATWASQDDPRETRVGGFLRRVRLDEIPQLINVIRGEMSLIGPRPERPGFFGQLHHLIPYYCERIIGVRPGITGFAQVYQAGDRTVDDVRTKLLYDHAYALALSRPSAWLALDLKIAARTILVVLFGTGLFTASPSPLGLQPPHPDD